MAVGWNRLVEHASELGPDPELAALDEEQLLDALGMQARRVTAETAHLIALLAELVVRGAWTDSGAKTPGQWASWKLGLASSTAREHVRVGLALRSLPKIRERFTNGTLSYSKVRAITRLADQESEDLLLNYADSCPAHQLDVIVARARQSCRALGIPADNPFLATNLADANDPDARVERLDVLQHEDGTRELRIRLDEADGARLEQHLLWLAKHQDSEAPADVRLVEAMLDAIEAAVRDLPSDASGEDRDRLVVQATVIEVPGASAEAPRHRVVPRLTTGRAPAMNVRTLERLACSAGRITVSTSPSGQPLDVGRTQRHATARQRRALLARDGGCAFPGCGATRHLHVHHAVEWEDGGRTDMDNLIILCSFHHRFVHNHDWHVRPVGGGHFRFEDALGEVVHEGASAEARGAELPIARRTLPDDNGGGTLAPRWWQGDPIDWELCLAVLAQEFERRRQPSVLAA